MVFLKSLVCIKCGIRINCDFLFLFLERCFNEVYKMYFYSIGCVGFFFRDEGVSDVLYNLEKIGEWVDF